MTRQGLVRRRIAPSVMAILPKAGEKHRILRGEEVREATPGTIFWILTNGVVRRGMPVWSKLPEAELWQIITFIRSLPPSSGIETHTGHEQRHAMSRTESPHMR